MIATTQPTLTIDEFLARHGGELGVELVDGQVVRYPMPGAKHGKVCFNAGLEVGLFLRQHPVGRGFSNDTFVRTEGGNLRGADVCFWSYERVPAAEPIPDGVIELPPEMVIEVRSPSDLWTDAIAKVPEYMRAGVSVVVVLDPKTESASVFRPGDRQEIFEKDDILSIPDVLPGFAVSVARFFAE